MQHCILEHRYVSLFLVDILKFLSCRHLLALHPVSEQAVLESREVYSSLCHNLGEQLTRLQDILYTLLELSFQTAIQFPEEQFTLAPVEIS